MAGDSLNKIVIIGSGNVATKFAVALKSIGKEILQIYSKWDVNAKKLADKVSAKYTDSLEEIDKSADIFIIALSDSVIEKIADIIHVDKGIIVHTAGTVDIDVLTSASENYGVLYPLQTLNKTTEIDFYNQVPLCIEAGDELTQERLLTLAAELSKNVFVINSERRRTLHLAAVFANNFTTYLYEAAGKILYEKNIPFEILKPLISETAKIAIEGNLLKVMTGPAVRNDMETISKHLNLLSKHPELKEVYRLITENIINDEKL